MRKLRGLDLAGCLIDAFSPGRAILLRRQPSRPLFAGEDDDHELLGRL